MTDEAKTEAPAAPAEPVATSLAPEGPKVPVPAPATVPVPEVPRTPPDPTPAPAPVATIPVPEAPKPAAPDLLSPLALVLLDTGSAANEGDAGAWLQRVYGDPHVLQLSLAGTFLDLYAWGISLSRKSSLQTALRATGGVAPERAALEKLAQVLALSLSARVGKAVQPFVAYRHAEPGIAKILEQARGAGCKRVVGLFARTFASSAGSDSMRAELSLCTNEFPELDISMVDGFEDDPAVRRAFAAEAKAALDALPEGERLGAHLLFLLQGQPVRGKLDPALPRAQAFAAAVREAMGTAHTFSLAYQTGVDPRADLMPEATEELERLAAEKRSAVVLIPLSHACEGLATRWEIDVALLEIARRAGIAHATRSRAPAESALFREALEELVRHHLEDMEKIRATA